MQRLADDFVSALARRDLGFRTPGRAVSRAILAPLEARLRGRSRLVVVPDGPLWDLPFQALIGSDGRFLVERLAVSYATSLTALREQRRRAANRVDRPRAVAAFGNPQLPPRPAGSATAIRADALAPLPAAAREARALGGLYGVASRVWVGREATEAAFKREAGAYAIVHVATHGILNDVDPMSSHLLLAPSGEGASAEDGRLQARELLGLGLDAELAVLSGCDTAKGRTGRGEGVIGLTWALFIAGVPTTVVSQWQVESESTEQLMVGLHRRLAATSAASPAEALRASAASTARLRSLPPPVLLGGLHRRRRRIPAPRLSGSAPVSAPPSENRRLRARCMVIRATPPPPWCRASHSRRSARRRSTGRYRKRSHAVKAIATAPQSVRSIVFALVGLLAGALVETPGRSPRRCTRTARWCRCRAAAPAAPMPAACRMPSA